MGEKGKGDRDVGKREKNVKGTGRGEQCRSLGCNNEREMGK